MTLTASLLIFVALLLTFLILALVALAREKRKTREPLRRVPWGMHVISQPPKEHVRLVLREKETEPE